METHLYPKTRVLISLDVDLLLFWMIVEYLKRVRCGIFYTLIVHVVTFIIILYDGMIKDQRQ